METWEFFNRLLAAFGSQEFKSQDVADRLGISRRSAQYHLKLLEYVYLERSLPDLSDLRFVRYRIRPVFTRRLSA